MRRAFAEALKKSRKSRGLTQEDFSMVSSRTYLSTLERGQKSPTLDKLQVISETIGIHLASLMTLTCLHFDEEEDLDALLSRIRSEVKSVENHIAGKEWPENKKA